MKQKQVLKDAAETLLNEAIALEVDVKPINIFHKKLQLYKLLPAKKILKIEGITMGALIRISKELLEIDLSIYDMQNLLESNYKAMLKYGELFARIIAIAISNSPENTYSERKLVKFVLRNFNAKELRQCMQIVLKQMSVENFMSSIISVKGLNVLERNDANVISAGKNEVSL